MQALNTELAKVTSQIEQLSFYRDKLTTLISVAEQANDAPVVKVQTPVVKVTPSKRRKYQRVGFNKQQFDRVSAFVAETCRLTACTKAKAIELAIDKYNLPKSLKNRIGSALTPSMMGPEAHNKLFSGTRYA